MEVCYIEATEEIVCYEESLILNEINTFCKWIVEQYLWEDVHLHTLFSSWVERVETSVERLEQCNGVFVVSIQCEKEISEGEIQNIKCIIQIICSLLNVFKYTIKP